MTWRHHTNNPDEDGLRRSAYANIGPWILGVTEHDDGRCFWSLATDVSGELYQEEHEVASFDEGQRRVIAAARAAWAEAGNELRELERELENESPVDEVDGACW